MAKKFQKVKEDFVCGNCKTLVQGRGFTNHCPNCLWSKHVDINPGDRAAVCGGMMEPIRLEYEGKEQVVVHRCVVCGFAKRNKAAPNDNLFDFIAKIPKT